LLEIELGVALARNKLSLRGVASILVVTFLGGSFLASVAAFSSVMPQEVPKESLRESFVLGQIALTDYSVIRLGPVNLVTLDDFSECVELGHVLSPQASNFDSRPTANDLSPCQDLNSVLSAAPSGEPANYAFYGRFWHGTAALTKLLLYVIDLSSIRALLTGMIILLTCSLTIVAFRKDVFAGATLGIFFFLASDIPFQGSLLTHGIPTLIGLLFCFAAYLVPKTSTVLYYALASLAGVFYAFFAQLFTPLLFMLLLVVFRILRTNESGVGDRFSTAVTGSMWWVFGYGAMMVARFLEVALRLGIEVTLSEFTSSAASKLTWNPLNLFGAVFGHLFIQTEGNHLRAVGFGLLMACLGFVLGLVRRRSMLDFDQAVKVAMPLAWIISWYLLMLGHNSHGFVANLSLGTLAYVILALRWVTSTSFSSSK
jgi:hypothetical protein